MGGKQADGTGNANDQSLSSRRGPDWRPHAGAMAQSRDGALFRRDRNDPAGRGGAAAERAGMERAVGRLRRSAA